MATYSSNLLRSFLFACVFALGGEAASAEVDLCGEIQFLAQDKNTIPLSFLREIEGEDLADVLTCLMRGMQASAPAILDTATRSTSGKDVLDFITYASAVRNLLQEKGTAAVQSFRERDDLTLVRTLAHATRHPERSVRLNASIILSNIIDNSNTCVILDNLYAPVEPELGGSSPDINGRANLVYVLRSVAKWARMENADAINMTVKHLKAEIDTLDSDFRDDLRQTEDGLKDVAARLLLNMSNVARTEEDGLNVADTAPAFPGTSDTFYKQTISAENAKDCADYVYDFPTNAPQRLSAFYIRKEEDTSQN